MGSKTEFQINERKFGPRNQSNRSKKTENSGFSNGIEKVKRSNKIPKFKTSHKKKNVVKESSTAITNGIVANTSTSTQDQRTANLVKNDIKPTLHPKLPKKVSKIYFDAYSKLPRKEEIYENEENKQPKDLPTMKLLEAIHGISSHYASENNHQIEGLLDTPALLCLGILVEEYTKHSTTDFMEKFDHTSNQV